MTDAEKIAALRSACSGLIVHLVSAREKLGHYRARHTGEYVGGLEYSYLMRIIDEEIHTAAAVLDNAK